jgi:inorganic triphosphatase YgiF
MALVLALTENGAARLADHPEFHSADARPQHLLSRYYDTASYELARAGRSLCVTRSGNTILQTLEAVRTSGMALRRDNWEWKLRDDRPDLALLPTIMRSKPPPEELQEIFTTDLTRIVRTLHLAPDTHVRASYDAGSMRVGATSVPVRELELELLNGAAGAVYHLALRLHAEDPLSIMIDSPATRGFRRAAGRAPAAQKAASVRLPAASSGAETFGRIAAACLRHLLVNQPAAMEGSVEGIHQMRVAIRRLRALLMLYRPALDPRHRQHFDSELKRIGRIFGQARDWDVFCTELLPQAGKHAELAEAVAALQAAAEPRRHGTHETFTAEALSPKFTTTILELAAWAEDGREMAGRLGRAKLARPLKSLAPRWLHRLARKVKNRGKNMSRNNDAELHELRKSVKKLRYGIEFTESLFAREKSRLYQKRCKALQETLGLINDSSTSVQLARTLVRETPGDLNALEALATYQKQRRQNGLDELRKPWKAFRREKWSWP